MMNSHNMMPYMQSLATCLNRMVFDGYTEDFRINGSGLELLNKGKTYKPEQIRVLNYFRFKGMSDPDDNAVLYVIETHDGLKGTMIDAYGIYTDARTGQFVKRITDIQENFVKN